MIELSSQSAPIILSRSHRLNAHPRDLPQRKEIRKHALQIHQT